MPLFCGKAYHTVNRFYFVQCFMVISNLPPGMTRVPCKLVALSGAEHALFQGVLRATETSYRDAGHVIG